MSTGPAEGYISKPVLTRVYSNNQPVINYDDLKSIKHSCLYLARDYFDTLPPSLRNLVLSEDTDNQVKVREANELNRLESAYTTLLKYILDNLSRDDYPELIAEINTELDDIETIRAGVEALQADSRDDYVIILGDLFLEPEDDTCADVDAPNDNTDPFSLLVDPDAETNPRIRADKRDTPDPDATDPGFDGKGFYVEATARDLLPPSDLTVEGELDSDFVLPPDGDTYMGEAPVEEPPVTEPGFVPPEGWADENYGVVDLYDSSIMVQGPQPDDTPFPGLGKK